MRRLLARALPPRALGGWMWLFAYAIMLAAVYSAQADWRRHNNAPAATGQTGVVRA